MNPRIAILHGGGPAPGSAGVFEGVVTQASRLGFEVLGIPEGFSHLRSGNAEAIKPLTLSDVRDASSAGGTFLPTSRARLHRPEEYETALKLLDELGVVGLVAVGGEDTGSSAAVLSTAADERGSPLKVVHVAKTIDGDIHHPEGLPTFGIDTAASEAAKDLEALHAEGLSNPDRMFLVGIMGRSSGELARRAASKAQHDGRGPDVTIVPELFRDKVPLEVVRNVVAGAHIKARARGRRSFVALISEGVLEMCTDESVKHLIADVPQDEHGHIQHSKIQFAYHLARLLEEFHGADRIGLLAGGKAIPATAIDIGYGRLRCGRPTPYDREYVLTVGSAAVSMLHAGKGGGTIFYRGNGEVHFYPFAKSIDPSSKRMRTRPMSLSEYKELLGENTPFLTERDLEDESLIGQTALTQYAFGVRFAAAVSALKHLEKA